MIAARLRLLPRGVRAAAWIVGAYLVVLLAFAFATRTTGLLSPSGAPNVGVLALGAVFLVLRLAAYVVAPALLAYAGLGAIVSRAQAASSARHRGPGDGAVGRRRFR
ncbi:MAG TPA: hypothetical protein VGG39_28880 [Polyangiaceae bacterium]